MKKMLICPQCGKEFERQYNAQRYCSAKCRRKANGKSKVKKVQKYKCSWCGKEFLSARRKKYCCKECMLFANSRLKVRETKPKKVLSIEEVAKLSREAGLSYGQYVQKYNI